MTRQLEILVPAAALGQRGAPPVVMDCEMLAPVVAALPEFGQDSGPELVTGAEVGASLVPGRRGGDVVAAVAVGLEVVADAVVAAVAVGPELAVDATAVLR